MRRLLRLLSSFKPQLAIIESAITGLFFVQALRFLVGMLYSRIASTSALTALPPGTVGAGTPGVIDPAVVQSEIGFLGLMIGLPILLVLFGRLRWLTVIAATLMAVGRTFMNLETTPLSITSSAAMVVGGGLLYLTLITRHRISMITFFFILGFGIDQLFRAAGNTLDLSLSLTYANTQFILSVTVVGLSLINVRSIISLDERNAPIHGLMPFWSGIALGGLLFLELSLLTLPNAIAGRARVDYTLFVPATLTATLLPIIPYVRQQARRFIGLFDMGTRGWVWLMLLALLLVAGTRIQGPIGGVSLVFAQFVVSMTWFWLARPQAEHERNFTGLWMTLSVLIFGVFFVSDIFTYEYAFVRNFAPPFTSLNNIIPPLLRGFRGMGLGLLLVAAFLALIPMIQTTRRIAWSGKNFASSLLSIFIVGATGIGGYIAAFPPIVSAIRNVPEIRIGTYNIHSGYNEFFHFDLEAIALTIQQSGADIILLQEVEAGRMTSFSIDQPLWLARRLGMDVRYFPTNEGLHGLAVLSKIPIVYEDGVLLSGIGNQTGLQRVQVLPDESVITIYNTWLNPLLAGEDTAELESEQQSELNQIFTIMFTQHYPDGELGRAVFGGTFNNVPDSPIITFIENETPFNDPFAGSNPLLSSTFDRTGVGRARLDYLWIWRQNLLETGTGVGDSRASDHRLAYVGVLIRRGE